MTSYSFIQHPHTQQPIPIHSSQAHSIVAKYLHALRTILSQRGGRSTSTPTLLRKNSPIVQKVLRAHKGWKRYLTHHNGDRPFLVYLKGTHAHVFVRPNSSHPTLRVNDAQLAHPLPWHYVVHAQSFTNVTTAWVGKSPINDTTRFTRQYGPRYHGNTILLTLTKNRHVFIGENLIYTFTTASPIIQYYSPMGNNFVPYPIAFTRDTAYFLLENDAIPLTRFNRTLTVKDKKNLYSAYYGYHPDLHITHAPTNFNSPLAPFSTKTLYTETY